jgi:TatD DNase family protein
MILTDTHSHIYLEDFDKDRDGVVLNALNQSVKYIFLPNIDSNSIERMLKLSKKYPDRIFPMIGLHPGSVEDDYKIEFEKLMVHLNKEKFYAIGEIGLDYYWDTTYVEEQKEIFEKQLDIALENNLPAIIHVRKAFNDVIEIIKLPKYKNLIGIFHCFSGSIEQAKIIIDNGFKLGIGGVVTFKNSKLDKVLEQIDLKHIVLETDSPYLAPEPKRGKRNESTYTIYIAKKIAEIKNTTLEEVAKITTKNAEEIFKIKLD